MKGGWAVGKKLRQMFSGKNKKEQALILVLSGILCLLVVWPMPDTDPDKTAAQTPSETSSQMETDGASELELYVENQEARLKTLLESIEGAGQVQVMLRIKATGEYVVEKDTSYQNSSVEETDSQGGSRSSTDSSRSESSVFTKDENGNDIPYVVKKMEPEIEGIVVSCEGGGEERVVDDILEAVQALYDVPAHKVKVVKMK